MAKDSPVEWKLFALSMQGRSVLVSGHASSEAALSAAQRLWKHRLRAIRIVGPAGQMLDSREIERFGSLNVEHAD